MQRDVAATTAAGTSGSVLKGVLKKRAPVAENDSTESRKEEDVGSDARVASGRVVEREDVGEDGQKSMGKGKEREKGGGREEDRGESATTNEAHSQPTLEPTEQTREEEEQTSESTIEASEAPLEHERRWSAPEAGGSWVSPFAPWVPQRTRHARFESV